MAGEIWVSASGLQSGFWALDALANDVANVDTTGFRAQFPIESSQQPVDAYPAGLSVGPALPAEVLADGGVGPADLSLDLAEGDLTPTGKPLDLAVDGEGFFALRDATGQTVYTRDGHFHADANGMIVDDQGRALLSVAGQPMRVPSGQVVSVDAHGLITAQPPGPDTATQRVEVGTVGLTTFTSPQGLAGSGAGAWTATANAGPAVPAAPGGIGGLIRPGYLENSNADLTVLLPRMLEVQRTYQANERAFNVGLQLWSMANDIHA